VTKEELKSRTKEFGIRVVDLVEALPPGRSQDILGRQLLRSGTSVGANYRAACRAKSVADFISKMGNVEEEADESMYWMEIMVARGMLNPRQAGPLIREANELLSIAIASIRTARRH
jgi:four helix bundle protein